MVVKKQYNVGDVVWIFGVGSRQVTTQGTVIHCFTLEHAGYSPDLAHYVIAVATEIEPLLEIRTWDTISESPDGPVNAFRNLLNPDPTFRYIAKTGFNRAGEAHDEKDMEIDPEIEPEIIHAALERAQKDARHSPLVLNKDTGANKFKRRYYPKKKKIS